MAWGIYFISLSLQNKKAPKGNLERLRSCFRSHVYFYFYVGEYTEAWSDLSGMLKVIGKQIKLLQMKGFFLPASVAVNRLVFYTRKQVTCLPLFKQQKNMLYGGRQFYSWLVIS